jgi:hypothetical protein
VREQPHPQVHRSPKFRSFPFRAGGLPRASEAANAYSDADPVAPANQYANLNADANADADEYADQHANIHADVHPDADAHPDAHTDGDQHVNADTN